MEYEIRDVDYRKILLDPLNPRFDGELKGKTQKQIIEYIEDSNDYRELFKSMTKGIRWINLIVIRPICDLDDDFKAKLNFLDIDKYDYIVIEGNTRLACLHNLQLSKKNNDIPASKKPNDVTVSIFKLKDDERNDVSKREKYNLEIMYIQGQANILKVKDWKDRPKCQHIYNTFIERRKLNNSEKILDIINDLAQRFSGKPANIRKALIRCRVVEVYEKMGYKIDKKYWGYFEAVETNAGKSYMGLNDKYDFCFSLDMQTNNIIFERYNEFYKLIQKYQKRKKSSKIFRNFFRKEYINNRDIDKSIDLNIDPLNNNEINISKKEYKKDESDINMENKHKELIDGGVSKEESYDLERNQHISKMNAKINDEYHRQERNISCRKLIQVNGIHIYDPRTEVDVYSSFVLLKYLYPNYININIPSYSSNTTYDSLAYYDNDDENLFWCDFKKVLPALIKNPIDKLHTIICWEISHKDRYRNFMGDCIDGTTRNLNLNKNDINAPGFKFSLIDEKKKHRIEIIELRDIWEIATGMKFM